MKNENGIEKSAILKGRTLVNNIQRISTISDYTTIHSNGIGLTIDTNGETTTSRRAFTLSCTNKIITNAKYTVIVDVAENTITRENGGQQVLKIVLNNYNQMNNGYVQINVGETGLRVFEIIASSIVTSDNPYMETPSDINGRLIVNGISIIEGHNHNLTGFIEGMQSVKNPSVKTTGKNLFDGLSYIDGFIASANNYTVSYDANVTSILVNVNKNTDYVLSAKTSFDRNTVGGSLEPISNGTKTTNLNSERLADNKIKFNSGEYTNIIIYLNSSKIDIEDIQVEEGSTATPYEPYKSNILTINEDVTLRAIGDVQDTLDLVTGELTERIGEVVFDGSSDENWYIDMLSNDSTRLNMTFKIDFGNIINFDSMTTGMLCDRFKQVSGSSLWMDDVQGIGSSNSNGIKIGIPKSKLTTQDVNGFKTWLSQNHVTVQYQLKTPTTKTVDLTIQDQDNQPQERMKLFPTGYISTSSSTFLPILELKGITHNNKLNMTTTNGTNNTQLTTLDNLVLDGIICKDGTVVRDSYDVESGLYTKRVFRFTIDEEFIDRYGSRFASNGTSTTCFEMYTNIVSNCSYPNASGIKGIASNIEWNTGGEINRIVLNNNLLYIRLLKGEVSSYDMDGILEWIKRNGAIEVAYQMATPQIIHMQPNMNPYVSTRPYQGEINSQGNALESSFLDYTQEESILSPKPLGEGDVLRWEQGSQCYVYENDKDYIPLTDYNQKVGTVLDLEDDEQFVENLDGGEIVVDVPFKEKAVYERELVSYEDTVIYPTNASADPDGKVEVDYICGATWQNPDDLSDIQHLGTLREDGQYDVTIRRSGDDEIRFMDGTTHLSLDHEGLNPSEFELTYYNKDNVEVGKYGDTSHTLENTLVDGKLETGMIYGETMVNMFNYTPEEMATWVWSSKDSGGVAIWASSGYMTKVWAQIQAGKTYTMIYVNAPSHYLGFYATGTFIDGYSQTQGKYSVFTVKDDYVEGTKANFYLKSSQGFTDEELANIQIIVVEGDYTNYPMDIPYFEGVNSTVVNGFTTTGKNLIYTTKGYEYNGVRFDVDNEQGTLTINGCYKDNDIYTYFSNSGGSLFGFANLRNSNYRLSYKIVGGSVDMSQCRDSRAFGNLYITDGKGHQYNLTTYADQETFSTGTIQMDNPPVLRDSWFRIHKGANFKNLTIAFQLEEGTVTTEFEPYHSIQYTLPSPITLNKVGDVADTYDVISGVGTRNIEKIVLDGSLAYNTYGLTDEYPDVFGGYYTFNNNYFNRALPPFINSEGMNQFDSDRFPGNLRTNEEGIVVTNNGNYIKFAIKRSKLTSLDGKGLKQYFSENPITLYVGDVKNPQTVQHTLIPSTVGMMQEPTFILPQPLRSVPNGICDRLYWDENKGHYCIEKRVEEITFDSSNSNGWSVWINRTNHPRIAMWTNVNKKHVNFTTDVYCDKFPCKYLENSSSNNWHPYYETTQECVLGVYNNQGISVSINRTSLTSQDANGFKEWVANNPFTVDYALATPEIIDLPHLNRKLELPTLPDGLPVGYKAVHPKMNPQIGLAIPYKQLNPPSQPQNLDFQMNKEDYVLTWNDVKEARQYNVILNDNIVATTKVPWYNTGEEIHGYILVEAQNEIADNLSKELYVKTVPKAPAQLTVAHNGLTDNYDFEISFIKSTSSLADRYTVQYRVDGGEWIIQDIPANEVDANVKVLWKFSVFEIKNQIEVWATATNDMGTNDILPLSTYYMTPTPQWTYRINSREVFLRWVDESPYDTQYKLRYQYKSDGIYRYAHFEGDKEEIGQLYEAVVALAEDDEVTLELCVISDRENLYCKPIKASKALDPNILPPKNFNYRWLSRGLIEFYWEDVYDVDLEYEAIVEHRLSGETTWIEDRRVFSATDTEGTGTVYRLQYQMEDLEEIRVKVRMKWAMNETEWSESLTTVFIPVEGNPPQWIRRTQTQEGLLVEWEAQEYIDSYHVYVKGDGVELQHLETRDNFIYVDIDYSNPIDIEIYEVSRFTGGIEAEPSDSMRFIPHQNKQQMINNIYHPDTLKYELEVNTVQKAQKVSYQINDINTTPDVRTREAMDVSISSPFIITYHPLEVDVHQKGVKSYGVAETHIKTLDVKTRETVEVLTFERITDKYGMDFTVYTPFASKYPVNLEINQVRIVCLGDSLTSGHPLYWAESGTGDVTASYPYQLAKRLKNQYEVINKGYGYFM